MQIRTGLIFFIVIIIIFSDVNELLKIQRYFYVSCLFIEGEWMKAYFTLITIILFSMISIGAVENEVSMENNNQQIKYHASNGLSFEGGLLNSAINGSTTSLTFGFVGDIASWFTLGVRGNVPLDSGDREGKLYSVQAISRINFLNNLHDNLFLEGFLSRNSGDLGYIREATFGGSLGYLRKVYQNFFVGLNVGGHFENGYDSTFSGETTLLVKRKF